MTRPVSDRRFSVLISVIRIFFGAAFGIVAAELSGIDSEQRRFWYPVVIAVATISGLEIKRSPKDRDDRRPDA
jgi:hypothetical protein